MLFRIRPENGRLLIGTAPAYEVVSSTFWIAGSALHTINRCWLDAAVIVRANVVALPAPLVSFFDAARSTETRNSLRWLLSLKIAYSSRSVSETMLAALITVPPGNR